MPYLLPLLVDVGLFVLCSAIAVRHGKLRHSHPTTIYLFFHLYTFTWRLFGLFGGAPTLFTDWGDFFDPVEPWEIQRAALLADLALVAITAATVLAARNVVDAPPRLPSRRLSPRLVWIVGLTALVPGLWAMTLYAPGSSPTEGVTFDPLVAASDSSYVQILPAWPSLVLLMLIYLYGFRPALVLPMIGSLLFMALQGYHRFRVIIPTLMLLQIYLDRRGRRWPPLATVAALVMIAALFFPMKRVGRMAQHGASASDMMVATADVTSDALSGRADDQSFLDEFASGMSLVDQKGKLFWGRPYIALVTLPVPRQFWKEKPTLSEHIKEISTPRRPMVEAGMILTYLGEAYANFWYVGIAFIPFALAWTLAKLHHAAYRVGYDSVLRFAYVMIASNLIQVYRDGLVSIVVFTAVNMMPLSILVLIHRGFVSPTEQDHPAAHGSVRGT